MRHNTGESTDESRAILRRELRNTRSAIPAHLRASHDEAIRQHLVQLVKTQRAVSIGCYWPFNGEPDIIPVCRQLEAEGCVFALPVVSGSDDHGMQFHSWHTGTPLARNRYGIYEPRESALIAPGEFDMLMMPLVGYDRFGNRLGMGAGFYDRHLESLRESDTPLRVGIAYSLQEIDPIARNSWDIPLHGVVNEHGWFTFAG